MIKKKEKFQNLNTEYKITEIRVFDQLYNNILVKWEKDYETKEITFWLKEEAKGSKIHKFKYE